MKQEGEVDNEDPGVNSEDDDDEEVDGFTLQKLLNLIMIIVSKAVQ